MRDAALGLIMGTGFDGYVDGWSRSTLPTPYGKVTLRIHESRDGTWICVLRHGEDSDIPAPLINFKANLWALRKVGVLNSVSASAVGILPHRAGSTPLRVGDIIIPDDLIDFTSQHTFYDGSSAVPKGAIYPDLSKPYCPRLRQLLLTAARSLNIRVTNGGTYVQVPGPRFSTAAEAFAFSKLGGDVIGMTNGPEAALARDLAMCYSTIAVCTNDASNETLGDELVDVESVVSRALRRVGPIIVNARAQIVRSRRDCACASALFRYPHVGKAWTRTFTRARAQFE